MAGSIHKGVLPWIVAGVLAGCGEAPVPSLSLSLTIDSALREETEALSLYALHPKRTDNVLLTCASLVQFQIEPDDARVKVLGAVENLTNFAESQDITLLGIEAGDSRLIYVTAMDGTGTVIGNGCEDDVKVPEGGTVQKTVRLFPLP